MASNSKRKRRILNIQKKLEKVNRLKKGESEASLTRSYIILESQQFLTYRETILNFASKLDSEDERKKRKTMREANDDRALYLWSSQIRSKEGPMSGLLLCEKAMEFNDKLGGSFDFKASTGWFKNFKARFQECDEEDVETWMACDEEGCGFRMLDNDEREIVTSVQEEFDDVYDETDGDDGTNSDESSKGPSNADAFSAL
ncbi:HTH CENPB-type domain-containing protein [Trichonephila clavipes]|nr:HTH CENPB-type domain-containing protein [Trichonephila clavipes]